MRYTMGYLASFSLVTLAALLSGCPVAGTPGARGSVDDTDGYPEGEGEGEGTDAGEGDGGDEGEGEGSEGGDDGAPAWDTPPAPFAVPSTCAALEQPILADALAHGGLTHDTLAITSEGLAQSFYASSGFLDDALLLPWLVEARAHPAALLCTQAAMVDPVRAALSGAHPTSALLLHAASLADRLPEQDTSPVDARGVTFDAALTRVCDAAAQLGSGACGAPEGAVPDELSRALVPVLLAVANGLDARAAIDAENVVATADAGATLRSPAWWRDNGGHMILLNNGQNVPSAARADEMATLTGALARRDLHRAAAQIAYAVEDADWAALAALAPLSSRDDGVLFELETPAGLLVIDDASAQRHADNGEGTALLPMVPVLLRVDLGGDDTYTGAAASNVSGANAVSVLVDVDGADRYGYASSGAFVDQPPVDGLLPADSHGRFSGNDTYGRVSLSRASRQGAARNGIALLFDLGGDDDTYRSLRASQGYAHLGAGALVDDGGDDTYESEVFSQGAAQFGIAVLLDRGAGNDVRTSYTESQGFAFAQAAALFVDEGGDDVNTCDVGDPAYGGHPIYFSPQLPGQGNTSLCQGAALGLRNDADEIFLSGGVALAVDVAGDDAWTGSLFAQGAGYWQGTGVLADLDGSDSYDALWYAQGGAAHYAIGALVDEGRGSDAFGANVAPVNIMLGAGHDFSAALLLNAAPVDGSDANDTYVIGQLSAGAGNCNGAGLFVDGAGDDSYTSGSTLIAGIGHTSTECVDERPTAMTAGLFIDAAGADTYSFPEMAAPPGNDALWGATGAQLASEHGAGLDRAD